MSFLQQYYLILFFILVVWLCLLSYWFWRIQNQYRKLTKGTAKKTLDEVFEKLFKNLDSNKNTIDLIKKEMNLMKIDSLVHLQKIGFIRYNPFPETGGNQSFCLALMDANNNGVVLSSLHNRESTRIYAKPIKEGVAKDYNLSAEEKQAINLAEKSKISS